MKTITDIIQPISLLSGSHADTATTGQGCFMNVIAYLNGEAQITDSSPCVCPTLRRIAIWINDYMKDNERNALLPFAQRAMGTATADNGVIKARLAHVVSFAHDMAALAKKYAAANANAAYAAKANAAYAYAAYAAKAAAYANAAYAYAAYAAKANAAYANAAYAYAANAAKANAAKAADAAYAAAAYAAAANADATARKEIIDRTLAFLDSVCPPADQPSQELIDRANKLIALGVQ